MESKREWLSIMVLPAYVAFLKICMDLLFFQRTLRRFVLIELKLGEFELQDKGQVELYLRRLEKYESWRKNYYRQ